MQTSLLRFAEGMAFLRETISSHIMQHMSMTEIIEELPRLSHHQRRELCQKIIELEAEHEDIAHCDEAARQGFAMLDQMESPDAARA